MFLPVGNPYQSVHFINADLVQWDGYSMFEDSGHGNHNI
jgi:hypothetical protein